MALYQQRRLSTRKWVQGILRIQGHYIDDETVKNSLKIHYCSTSARYSSSLKAKSGWKNRQPLFQCRGLFIWSQLNRLAHVCWCGRALPLPRCQMIFNSSVLFFVTKMAFLLYSSLMGEGNVLNMGNLHCLVVVLVSDEKLNCLLFLTLNFFKAKWAIFHSGSVEPHSGWWFPIGKKTNKLSYLGVSNKLWSFSNAPCFCCLRCCLIALILSLLEVFKGLHDYFKLLDRRIKVI